MSSTVFADLMLRFPEHEKALARLQSALESIVDSQEPDPVDFRLEKSGPWVNYQAGNEFLRRWSQGSTSPTHRIKHFSLNDLWRIAKTPTSLTTMRLIAELVQAGILEEKIRVESPTGNGAIEDFDGLKDLPAVINDWRSDGEEIPITPQMVTLLYKLSADSR